MQCLQYVFYSQVSLQKHGVCVTIPRPHARFIPRRDPSPLNGSEILGSATVSRSLSLNDKSYSGVAGLKRNGVGCHGTCKFY